MRPSRARFFGYRKATLLDLQAGLICDFEEELMAFFDASSDSNRPVWPSSTVERKLQRAMKKR